MQTKTAQALQSFATGDIKAALLLASTFRIGVAKSDCKALKTGYECIVHPSFYIQLGKDPAACIEAAKEVFKRVFIKE